MVVHQTAAYKQFWGIELIVGLKEVPLLVNYIDEIMNLFWLHLVGLNGSELAANRDVLRLAGLGEATELDALAEQQAVG